MTNRFNGLRVLLLASALALLLIPLLESRANAAYSASPFCQPFATPDRSKWVPPRSYCSRSAPGYPTVEYGSFDSAAVSSGTNGLRRCAIIDVYRRSPAGLAHRYKTCTYGGDAWAYVTNAAYKNPFVYFMLASAYNGSDKAQLLSGVAFGYAF
jgi:hypothetical protein